MDLLYQILLLIESNKKSTNIINTLLYLWSTKIFSLQNMS
jgi:hypothetical protein